MVRILICYASFSGNTQEVAKIMMDKLTLDGHEVSLYRIGSGQIPDPRQYDVMFLGTFTWGKGATPIDVKDFVYELGYTPPNIYVFGTGDTQFGGYQLFCYATVKLAKFYQSTYPPLKIEQSPRGFQEIKVIEWTEGVMKHCQQHLGRLVY